MITIEYCAEGIPVSDFAVEQYMVLIHNSLQHDHNQHWRFSTSPIFTAIRLEVLEDRIDPAQIRFLYDGHLMEMDTYGQIDNWARGFCECDTEYSQRLILGAMQKYRLGAMQKYRQKEQHAELDSQPVQL